MKTVKVLPKTAGEIENGGLYAQAVRCGKANCKCSRGETHTAFYFFTRRNGKLVKTYVRRAEIETFVQIVKKANVERQERRQAVKDSAELLDKFRSELWSNEGYIKTLKGNKDYE